MRPWPALILLLALPLRADTDALLARARVRMAHGNRDGAVALAKQVLAEDPHCEAALAMLLDTPSGALRYLRDARAYDLAHARQALLSAERFVVDWPEDVYLEAERAAMLPLDGGVEAFGPWRPWERPARLPPRAPPCGPLRGEVAGTRAHEDRDALLRVADWLDARGCDDAVARASLAISLAALGERSRAAGVLASAHAASDEERLHVACATIAVAPDPVAGWRANAEALRTALMACRPSDETQERVRRLLEPLRRPLALAGDLEGLVRLAEAIDLAERDDYHSIVLSKTLDAIEEGIGAEEACRRLEGSSDPASVMVHAALLYEMRQRDRAVETILRLTSEHPDYLPGWATLVGIFEYRECTAPRLRAEKVLAAAGYRVRSVADAGGPPEAVVERAMREGLHRNGRTAMWAALSAGRVDLAMTVLDRAEEEGADPLSGEIASSGGEVTEATLRDLARRCAAAPRMGGAHERFLRSILSPSDGRDRDDGTHLHLRVALEEDASLRKAPGGDYVLSMLLDERIEPDRVLALCRSSYRAGCVARGLLDRLACAGDGVLPDLAAIDPAEARLFAALRADGDGALRAFLEDDEASSEQVARARSVLLGRGVLPVEPWTAEATTPGECARALREKIDAGSIWRLVESLRDGGTWCGGLAEAIDRASADGRRPDAGDLRGDAPPADLAGLADRAAHSCDDEWEAVARRVIQAGGEAAVRRLLSGRTGASWANALMSWDWAPDPDILPTVSAEAARHTLDLRWCYALEDLDCAKDQASCEAAREALRRADAADPARLLWAAAKSKSAAEARGLVQAYFAAREGDTAVSIMKDLGSQDLSRPEVGEPLVELLLRRCADDAERDALAWEATQHARWMVEAIDKALVASACREARLGAMMRERRGSDAQRDLAAAREEALDAGWSAREACTLWAWIGIDALAAKRDDLAEESIDKVWELGLRRVLPPTPEALFREEVLQRQPGLWRVVRARLQRGGAGPWWWWLATMSQPANDAGLPRADDELARLGYATREVWLRRLVRDAGDPSRACAAGMGRGGGEARSWYAQAWVEAVAGALVEAGRTEAAVRCVDDWAARCERSVQPECWNGFFCFHQAKRPEEFSADGALRWGLAPSGMLAADILELEGLNEEAWTRAAAAIPAARFPLERLGCLRAKAGIELGMAFPEGTSKAAPESSLEEVRLRMAGRAVGTLREILALAEDASLRRVTYEELTRIYDVAPQVRGLFVAWLLEGVAGAAPPAREELSEWTARLGASDSAARAAAEEDLRAHGLSVLPLLRALAESDDPEVRGRVEDVLVDLARP